MRFRKKPVEIEAMQWPAQVTNDYETASAIAAIHRWVNGNGGKTEVLVDGDDVYPTIVTLEGHMRISPGDWVIRGVQGEFYPCKPDIFEATYEQVDP